MEDTYNIKVIILNRRPSGECDSRVAVYSREFGKLELTARGAKKIKSKLAGHLEPLNLVDIMVVRGRRYDYVGAAVSENCFGGIKNDLAKLVLAIRAVKIVDQLIKPGLADEKIFSLLKDYLERLDEAVSVIPATCGELSRAKAGIQKDSTGDNYLVILAQFFILKLLSELGHQPELSVCVSCAAKIKPGNNKFDLARGGLVCFKCAKSGDGNQLLTSDDSIKLLRLALKIDFNKLEKVKIGKKLGEEIEKIIGSFLKYSFN